MKKIAIITTGLSKVLAGEKGGGGEIVLKNCILSLLKIPDIKLTIFTFDTNEVISEIKSNYPEIDFRQYYQSPGSYKYIDELKKIFENEVFDKIINFNMVVPYKTTILQSHSYLHKLNKVNILFRFIKKYILRNKIAIQTRAFKRASNDSDYIAVSQIIKDDYCKYLAIPQEKIKVIYPGVNIAPIKNIEKKETVTLSIVANSSINKGGHYFLIALGLLNLAGRKFKLNIIAPKFKKDLLMQLIILIFGLSKKVKAFPYQNDMTNFYNETDILVVPSLNEAFGLVTIEAMSYSIPCLVSSNAGSSEIINSNNGVIFNRKSFYDFIKKLNYFINLYNNDFEKFKNISYAARKTAENYSWSKFVVQVINTNE